MSPQQQPARNINWGIVLGSTAAAVGLALTLLAFKVLLPGSEPDGSNTVAYAPKDGDARPEEVTSGDDVTPKEGTTNSEESVLSPFEGLLRGGQSSNKAALESDSQVTANRNLTLLSMGLHNFHDAFNSFPLPAKKESDSRDRYADDQGRVLLSWRVHVLPYLNETQLYLQFRLDEPCDSPHNQLLIAKMPKIYEASEVGTKPGYT